MKKIVLSIAGVMAAAAFAPEASALPAFARQTGMACNACHQQHFPVLNGFGRAFKAAGFTMMGAQEKVEAEHLSIPNTLNAAILLKARYQKTNGKDAANVVGANTNTVVSGSSTNSGQFQLPDEFALFFGGRVAENIGFLLEGSLVGGGLGNGSLVAGIKLPIVFDMGGVKLSAIPFTTDVLGPGYGYEESCQGIVAGIRWSEHGPETSSAQYVGMRHAAAGAAFVAKNDMGYINFTRYTPGFALAGGGAAVAGAAATGTNPNSNWVRIAATPTVADWDMHIGAGFASGSSNISNGAGLFTTTNTKLTVIDAQAFGEVGGKDLGVYFTYASAPGAVVGAVANQYNAGTMTKRAYTIGADYSVIPHTLHLGAAYRNANTGRADVVTAGNESDNPLTVQAIYDLYQNVALHATYSKYSGSAYNVGNSKGAPAIGGVWNGTSKTTLMLEAAW